MKLGHKFPVVLGLLTSLLAGSSGVVLFALWSDLSTTERVTLTQMAVGREALLMLLVLALVFAAAVAVQIVFRAYLVPAIRLDDGVRVIHTANAAHRVTPAGGEEMRRLAHSVNSMADAYQALRLDVDAKISEANVRIEEERNRLAALMSDLTQSVLVCNAEGRILLYNARAKQLLDRPSEGTSGIGAAYVGLGRSIFSIVDKRLIVHALDSVKHRLMEGAAAPSAHFVMTQGSGQLVRACMAPVVDREGTLSGFVLTLDDITRSVELNSRRDALLQSLTEGTRASLANIRAAIETMQDFPDMDTVRRGRLAAVIREEAEKLSAGLSQTVTEHADTLKAQWPLEDMLGSDLLAMLKRHLETTTGITIRIDTDDVPVWLKVDSYSLVQTLAQLVGRVRAQFGAQAVCFKLTPQGRFARLEMNWPGTVSGPDWTADWESHLLGPAADSTTTLQEVLERHGAEAWCTAELESNMVRLCLQLPLTKPEAAPSAPARLEGRPEYYDFDLFHQPGQSAELDQRPLSELVYTVFDTETTGLNPSEGDEIISIGAVRIVNGRLLRQEVFEQLIDARRPMSDESVKIHGISASMLAGQPGIEAVLPAFYRFAEDTVLVAHNAAFDMRFLQLKEAATGIKFIQPVLDTLLLSAAARPNDDQAQHNLESLAARLGIPVVGRHTALGDAMVTGEILLKLIPLLAERGIVSLMEAREASQKTLHAKLGY